MSWRMLIFVSPTIFGPVAVNKSQKLSHAGGIPNYNNVRLHDYMKIHHDIMFPSMPTTRQNSKLISNF
jgi:hypothetical protein